MSNDITPRLADYDLILVNSSAGKDSQAMLDVLAAQAEIEGVQDRMVVVHCDLGKVEWPGTLELAQRQAEHYGFRFEVVRNRNWDSLLDRIEARGMWPDSKSRYCTSEFKTGQVKRLCTQLVAEFYESHPLHRLTKRPVRILNCLGIRAQESPARAAKEVFRHLEAKTGWTNGKRHVDEWLPIHDWSLEQVWERINASGVEHHYAYDEGMPRLSCMFCVFGSCSSLRLAARMNPELAEEYVALEDRMGHTFRNGRSLLDILTEDVPGEKVENWAA